MGRTLRTIWTWPQAMLVSLLLVASFLAFLFAPRLFLFAVVVVLVHASFQHGMRLLTLMSRSPRFSIRTAMIGTIAVGAGLSVARWAQWRQLSAVPLIVLVAVLVYCAIETGWEEARGQFRKIGRADSKRRFEAGENPFELAAENCELNPSGSSSPEIVPGDTPLEGDSPPTTG